MTLLRGYNQLLKGYQILKKSMISFFWWGTQYSHK